MDLLGDILEEEVKCLGLLTIVGDADTGARDNLASIALSIDFAEASPLTKLGVVRHSHQVDAVLGTESADELLVCWLRAVVSEDTQVHNVLVEHAGTLADSASETIVAEGLLEHLLEGRHGIERLGLNYGLGGSDFNWGIPMKGGL